MSDEILALIRDVPDFPKPGILFRDITPLLENSAAFTRVIDTWAKRYAKRGIAKIAGIESRGFIFASALALRLGTGLVLMRKPGKLPCPTFSAKYALEYGEDSLHMHRDALKAGESVMIVDDVLATGGTLRAAVQLARQAGANVQAVSTLIELAGLKGRAQLSDVDYFALLTY